MSEFVRPSRTLIHAGAQAIRDFSLIREGDRIVVGLSGGKDSLSLLHLLAYFQRRAPVRFELAAANIDPQMPGYDPAPLRDYVTGLGLPFFQESFSLIRQAKQSFSGRTLCSFCSRMRRGLLYRICRDEGYGVLALAHHLDDAAETWLMNSFFGGKLRAMPAAYTNDDGDLRVIRPLIYARERQAAGFAETAGLPVIPDNCPTCDSTTRQRVQMKHLLGELEAGNPNLFASLKTALGPLLADPAGAQPLAASAPAAEQPLLDLRRAASGSGAALPH